MRSNLIFFGLVFGAVILLFSSFVSAGWLSDWYKQITGRATSVNVNISLINTAPVIVSVPSVASASCVQSSIRNFAINFTVYDEDGAGQVNFSSAQARLQKSGETTRSNTTCNTAGGAFGTGNKYQNLTCTVALWYFDSAGAWTINTTIQDNSTTTAENSTTTLTFSSGSGNSVAPASLTWPGTIQATSTNVGSNNDPLLFNNTCNTDFTNISIMAIDLAGETIGTQYIYAGNFSANWTDASDGMPLINGSAVQIPGANLTRGNYSLNNNATGQEQIFVYLEALNPGLSSQAYSTTGGGAWQADAQA